MGRCITLMREGRGDSGADSLLCAELVCNFLIGRRTPGVENSSLLLPRDALTTFLSIPRPYTIFSVDSQLIFTACVRVLGTSENMKIRETAAVLVSNLPTYFHLIYFPHINSLSET